MMTLKTGSINSVTTLVTYLQRLWLQGLLTVWRWNQQKNQTSAGTLPAWLRKQLRRCPQWLGGHLALAKCSVATDDMATAFASAHAAKKLAVKASDQAQSKFILGVCYLRRGAAHKAVELLEPLLHEDPKDVSIKEELAAAYMLLDRERDAERLLTSIAVENRSVGAQAALGSIIQKD